MSTYFTSESVCIGHPDKICDIISDSILDEALRQNPMTHNAVECTIKDNTIFIYGETDTPVNYRKIARKVVKEIGHEDKFDVILRVSEQSPEINSAVSSKEDLGAGDQGIIFGYACDETKEYMPLSISLAHEIARKLDSRNGKGIFLPDGKTQVTTKYDDQGRLECISTFLVSKQHKAEASTNMIYSEVMASIKEAYHSLELTTPISLDAMHINPSGSFTIGGPKGDSGTTGRKIVVDTYGGHGRVGGGCFSSKDPTKVDRSAAYYARYVAKSIVAAGFASKCEVQVSYGIGLAKPISVHIDCFRTNKIPMEHIYALVDRECDFRPQSIIETLDLRKPIYAKTACYGAFGNPEYPWEKNLISFE